jgi:hypothetical protein
LLVEQQLRAGIRTHHIDLRNGQVQIFGHHHGAGSGYALARLQAWQLQPGPPRVFYRQPDQWQGGERHFEHQIAVIEDVGDVPGHLKESGLTGRRSAQTDPQRQDRARDGKTQQLPPVQCRFIRIGRDVLGCLSICHGCGAPVRINFWGRRQWSKERLCYFMNIKILTKVIIVALCNIFDGLSSTSRAGQLLANSQRAMHVTAPLWLTL